MNPAVGRRRAFLLTVFGISFVVLCLNLFINPWWIALWRFVQSVVLFSLLLWAGTKWLIPMLFQEGSQEEGQEEEVDAKPDDVAGQHVDLVADDSRDKLDA